MRRLKRSTALLQCSRNCLRGCRGSFNEPDFARTKSREPEVNRAFSAALLGSSNPGALPQAANDAAPLALNRYRCGRCRLKSVLDEKLVLAASAVRPRRRTVKSLRADLPQRGAACRITSTLSRNDTHAQNGKGYCYCPRYCRFNGEFHLAIRSLMRTVVFFGQVFRKEAFRRSSLAPPPKLKETMLSSRSGSCLRLAAVTSNCQLFRSRSTNLMQCVFILRSNT